jgi:peptidyl-prolyl cis-trans isomerase B (cyclophilin B)
MVILETNLGPIKLELDEKGTPETCKNFLNYVEKGFYDNTLFHRVINGFVVQGGGFDLNMSQKPTDGTINNEADKGGKNARGTLAMARTSDPHSASSQFFINLKDNNFLNFNSKDRDGWGYCVFARVVDGMDIVDKIAEVETTNRAGHQDVPEKDVYIKSATVVKD